MNKQIITLSNNAANRIKEIMSAAKNPAVAVRVGVTSICEQTEGSHESPP